jgi:L-threonylcarbamoyladenylate synthase
MLKSTMLILPFIKKDSDRIFKKSSEILKSRGIIAYSTESFYALGVLATDEYALKKLFDLKQRPVEKPLPIIVGDLNLLLSIARQIPPDARKLIEKFWPGPLTLIFDARENVPGLLTCGTGKVAARIPGKSIALDLAQSLGLPLTSTSANPSGQQPSVETSQLIRYFGDKIDLIIDGGRAPGGKPSTIVDVTVEPPKVLRTGRIIL